MAVVKVKSKSYVTHEVETLGFVPKISPEFLLLKLIMFKRLLLKVSGLESVSLKCF